MKNQEFGQRTKKEKIEELLSDRKIETIFPSKEKAYEILSSGKGLTFYFGVDPTGPDLHLGNITNLFVLKKLVELRHRVILLIGDFTAQIGDPTDKDATRKPLSEGEAKANAKDYLRQVNKILPKGSFQVKYNTQWLSKIKLRELVKLASQFTVQQMLARDMFQKRVKEQKPISIHEFLYPLMQGYDSVAMKVDGEIGGTDQTFNMLIGRDLVRTRLQKEKLVITTKLLEDPTTGKKVMNKSEGQYISLTDSPQEMFAKTMALPDHLILPIFSLSTEITDQKLQEIDQRLASEENPKQVKQELALELVKLYYGGKEAQKAQAEFRAVFEDKNLPKDAQEILVKEAALSPVELLLRLGIASKAEVKRLLEQGAVDVDQKKITDWHALIKISDGLTIKVGAHRYFRIRK